MKPIYAFVFAFLKVIGPDRYRPDVTYPIALMMKAMRRPSIDLATFMELDAAVEEVTRMLPVAEQPQFFAELKLIREERRTAGPGMEIIRAHGKTN